MDKKIYWGISQDLQADIRYEPNACKGYVMDISLGCPHRCIYCIFSPLELRIYKLKNPSYKGDVLPLKLDKILERKDFPPAVYLCYSSDPLGNEELRESTKKILRKLISENVTVFFISKGIFTQDIINIISSKPDLFSVQVGITSADAKRNKAIEPGAPSYEERLENFKMLRKIPGLASLTARMDPLLPGIDDSHENIQRVIGDLKGLGVSEVVFGYMILTENMRRAWKKREGLSECANLLTEKTPTISEQELYSVSLEYKLKKFTEFHEICHNNGVKMACCACKDERLKETDFEWICHPFNRKRREELFCDVKDNSYRLEVDHIK